MNMNELVERLQKANWAYRNTDQLLMTDDEYDKQLEQLRALAPSHPFLTLIGAKPDAGSVLLPVTMGSLDKVRYQEGGLARWKKRKEISSAANVLIAGKLDGISALFVSDGNGSARLYLRGDGVMGVDVSRIIPTIGLSLKKKCMIRGELILPNDKTPAKSIGRSLVNGWVHRALDTTSPIPSELTNVQFVGYQLIEPLMQRGQQMIWLTTNGIRIPTMDSLPISKLDDMSAFTHLQTMKEKSPWPLDGIVISTDTVPVSLGGGEAKNPPDSVAFKAALDEQRAETTVIGVEWNISRQGMYIPRIQIEAVEIGGATIQWLSGHNAKFIEENRLGTGARIVIIRSGDVIPSLSSVITPCQTASMPTSPWTWDASHTHALATVGEISPELAAKTLHHAIETVGVEGIGPGLVSKMVEAGYLTLRSVLDAEPTRLGEAIGPGRVKLFLPSLREAVTKATPLTLMIASNLLPKGVGEKKLRPLFAVAPDPRTWTLDTFGKEGKTSQTILDALPAVIAWCNSIHSEWVRPSVKAETQGQVDTQVQRKVAFTGVRPDSALQERMKAAGWVMEDLTKQTLLLVTSDEAKDSSKVQLARKRGVEICSISEFRSRC
jgi:NAD-dependent DNA ligase